MKKYNFLFLLFFALACKNKTEVQSENNVDAARNFIRAALDGKFTEARDFMLQDSLNINYMDVAERSYKKENQATQDGYRASSIHIHEVKPVNDSTTIIVYSNSFKNKPNQLRIVRINEQWLVDLKYLYQNNWDTLAPQQVSTDTLK